MKFNRKDLEEFKIVLKKLSRCSKSDQDLMELLKVQCSKLFTYTPDSIPEMVLLGIDYVWMKMEFAILNFQIQFVPRLLNGNLIIPLATRIINVTGIPAPSIIEPMTKISLLSIMIKNWGIIYFKNQNNFNIDCYVKMNLIQVMLTENIQGIPQIWVIFSYIRKQEQYCLPLTLLIL